MAGFNKVHTSHVWHSCSNACWHFPTWSDTYKADTTLKLPLLKLAYVRDWRNKVMSPFCTLSLLTNGDIEKPKSVLWNNPRIKMISSCYSWKSRDHFVCAKLFSCNIWHQKLLCKNKRIFLKCNYMYRNTIFFIQHTKHFQTLYTRVRTITTPKYSRFTKCSFCTKHEGY